MVAPRKAILATGSEPLRTPTIPYGGQLFIEGPSHNAARRRSSSSPSGPRTPMYELSGMAFVEHGGFKVKDLSQLLDKLLRKGSAPVDQQHARLKA